MKRKTYKKPTTQVVQLQHRIQLLSGGSGTLPEDEDPEYDDWN